MTVPAREINPACEESPVDPATSGAIRHELRRRISQTAFRFTHLHTYSVCRAATQETHLDLSLEALACFVPVFCRGIIPLLLRPVAARSF